MKLKTHSHLQLLQHPFHSRRFQATAKILFIKNSLKKPIQGQPAEAGCNESKTHSLHAISATSISQTSLSNGG